MTSSTILSAFRPQNGHFLYHAIAYNADEELTPSFGRSTFLCGAVRRSHHALTALHAPTCKKCKRLTAHQRLSLNPTLADVEQRLIEAITTYIEKQKQQYGEFVDCALQIQGDACWHIWGDGCSCKGHTIRSGISWPVI